MQKRELTKSCVEHGMGLGVDSVITVGHSSIPEH